MRAAGRRLRWLAAGAAAALTIFIGGCGNDEPAEDAPRKAEVDIAEFRYMPETITIAAGGTVAWGNGDVAPHTATLDDRSQDTGTIRTAKTKALVFAESGTYSYFCDFHPFMKGVVEVTGSG